MANEDSLEYARLKSLKDIVNFYDEVKGGLLLSDVPHHSKTPSQDRWIGLPYSGSRTLFVPEIAYDNSLGRLNNEFMREALAKLAYDGKLDFSGLSESYDGKIRADNFSSEQKKYLTEKAWDILKGSDDFHRRAQQITYHPDIHGTSQSNFAWKGLDTPVVPQEGTPEYLEYMKRYLSDMRQPLTAYEEGLRGARPRGDLKMMIEWDPEIVNGERASIWDRPFGSSKPSQRVESEPWTRTYNNPVSNSNIVETYKPPRVEPTTTAETLVKASKGSEGFLSGILNKAGKLFGKILPVYGNASLIKDSWDEAEDFTNKMNFAYRDEWEG